MGRNLGDGKVSKGGRFGLGRGNLLFCFDLKYSNGDCKLVVSCAILAEFSGKIWVGGKI